MKQLTVYNTSNNKLKTIALLAFPKSLLDGKNWSIESVSNPEIKYQIERFKSVGDITDLYTAYGDFESGSAQYKLVETERVETPFQVSPWTSLNPGGNIIRAILTLTNGEEIPLWIGGEFKIDNATPHTVTFKCNSSSNQGWLLTQFLTVNHNLDVVDFKLAVNWHDRTNPSVNTTIKSLRIEANSEIRVNFGRQLGLTSTYSPMTDTWKMVVIPSDQDIRDGQGIELRGKILTLPENFINYNGHNEEVVWRLNNLAAVRNGKELFGGLGEVYGTYNDLNENGNWFNRFIHKVDGPSVSFLSNPFFGVGIFGARKIGALGYPGSSGAQEDFGADKGLEATAAYRPQWVSYYKCALVDRMRNFNIFEPDGTKVTKEKHPSRITWNMVTFDALSQDFLGKTRYQYGTPGNGYYGYDTQHRTMNGLLTYYALTGDELVLDTLQNALEADRQQAKNLELADREVGRTFACWVKMFRVFTGSDKEKVRQLVLRKFQDFKEYWRGRLIDPSRTVKVSQVIIDPRSNIVNPDTGLLEPSWICYQHAQMIAGLYSLWIEFGNESIAADVLSILKDLCKTYVNHGVLKDGGNWYPIIFSRYRTGLASGQPLNPTVVGPDEGLGLEGLTKDNWQIELDLGNNGWWNWVGPALAVAQKVLEGTDAAIRAQEILTYAFPTGRDHIDTACWFPI